MAALVQTSTFPNTRLVSDPAALDNAVAENLGHLSASPPSIEDATEEQRLRI